MLFFNPIPGHEEKNHLGIKINDPKEVDDWIQKLLFFPDAFNAINEKTLQFQQKIEPLLGAQSVIELLTSIDLDMYHD
jgi:processive 1,2-diacylglycerol beta-glucosyltransferase